MSFILSNLFKKKTKEEVFVTDGDTVEIRTANRLVQLQREVNAGYSFKNKTVLLMNDIDLTDENLSSWTSIGDSHICPFEGVFDGGGHIISGIKIKKRALYQGLFGHLNHAVVKNITVSGTIEGSGNYVGGIAAFGYMASVENCVNLCDISNSGETIGGIIGYNIGGTISGCTNNGNIKCRDKKQVGSIVGYNSKNGTVESCRNTGSITANGEKTENMAGCSDGEIIVSA